MYSSTSCAIIRICVPNGFRIACNALLSETKGEIHRTEPPSSESTPAFPHTVEANSCWDSDEDPELSGSIRANQLSMEPLTILFVVRMVAPNPPVPRLTPLFGLTTASNSDSVLNR